MIVRLVFPGSARRAELRPKVRRDPAPLTYLAVRSARNVGVRTRRAERASLARFEILARHTRSRRLGGRLGCRARRPNRSTVRDLPAVDARRERRHLRRQHAAHSLISVEVKLVAQLSHARELRRQRRREKVRFESEVVSQRRHEAELRGDGGGEAVGGEREGLVELGERAELRRDGGRERVRAKVETDQHLGEVPELRGDGALEAVARDVELDDLGAAAQFGGDRAAVAGVGPLGDVDELGRRVGREVRGVGRREVRGRGRGRGDRRGGEGR
mmetsp:Transcript_12297/g.33313  ORF Transcript_12297/g.33313 Transcript_12297/m.33313 type:complete len:273 (-) Transcript_12297:337-1155(-)